jgi:hypothetical protein
VQDRAAQDQMVTADRSSSGTTRSSYRSRSRRWVAAISALSVVGDPFEIWKLKLEHAQVVSHTRRRRQWKHL